MRVDVEGNLFIGGLKGARISMSKTFEEILQICRLLSFYSQQYANVNLSYLEVKLSF
ncbi:protein of unknown function [Candidatus Nitrosocosmicus franklandus]|uniref:Uncharacterized protein n=1 Tax=Candidatus Nitrosocosmicus franklandianus TaxID=1798806 RepID=A0A484IFS4_9ARCH|nr:protein of unknown function [Candidatus Nitrosocosmicus franklandus]